MLISCKTTDPKEEEITFEFGVTQENNSISLNVIPSNTVAEYVTGIVMEDDYTGLEDLTSWIEQKVAEGTQVPFSGNWSGLFDGLFWYTRYYAYAAQVYEGKVVGIPVVKEQLIYRPYVDFAPEGALIAPSAISDNGLWVVGNMDGGSPASFIYDVRRDSLTVVEGVLFYDVTDDGKAYGRDLTSPIIYWSEDGHIITATPPSGSMQSGFYGVTPDGNIAVGYSMDEMWNNNALIFQNGILSTLEGTDLNGNTPAGIVAKGIGSNGNIAGYLIDYDTYAEVGCMWTGTSHTFDLYPKDLTVWNPDLLDGGGAFEKRYGGQEIKISPNGKYLAGNLYVTESWEYMPTFTYVYDTENKVMYELDNDEYMDWMPCAVTSDGLLFLANVPMGISDQPYVYDISNGKVQTFADYASAKYGYDPEGATIQGSVLAVSGDSNVMLGIYADASAFYTAIYFMPR